jgi:hypothetical protein
VLTLISNRPAADRAEAPAATRSRKSPEYGAGISSPNDMLRHQPSLLFCFLQNFLFSNLPVWKPL